MKERKSFITENTKIILDEDVFKIKAQRLFWKQMVEYANNKYGTTDIELKITNNWGDQHGKTNKSNSNG